MNEKQSQIKCVMYMIEPIFAIDVCLFSFFLIHTHSFWVELRISNDYRRVSKKKK